MREEGEERKVRIEEREEGGGEEEKGKEREVGKEEGEEMRG